MTDGRIVRINGQWDLWLPEHRAARPEWTSTEGWERKRIDSMFANLKPGMCLFDIGAEEADMCGLWASWGCDVVLVEPNPRVWPNAKAIFEANGLTPRGWFVGFAGTIETCPQSAEGWQTARDGWPRCAYGEVIGDHGFCQLNERPDIPCTTIDALARQFGDPDALTLDVEGSELEVLLGAHRVLKEVQPLLWISVHPHFMADSYQRSVSRLWNELDAYGYKWRLLDYDHELHVFAWVPGKHEPVLPE